MKKILKFIFLFVLFGLFVYHFFIYFDKDNKCFITIIPSYLPSNLDTKEAIRIIKYATPDNYQKLCTNIEVIDMNPSCGGFDGGCFRASKPQKIYVGNDQSNPAVGSAIIIHEMCHAMQAREGRYLDEVECYEKSTVFLDSVTKL